MGAVSERLITMSVQAGILILAILLLQRLAKKHISPLLGYALWILPALRLFLPFTFESGVSVMNLVPSGTAGPAATPTPSPAPLPSFAPGAAVVATPGPALISPTPALAVAEPSAGMIAAPVAPAGSAPAAAAPDILEILFWVWLGGAALAACYMLFINLRFYMRVRRERVLLDIPSETKIYRMDGLASPCLCGFFRPYILVNGAALANEGTLSLVLRHELCHKKQGDQWWGLLRNMCCALHWFNPLVWYAAIKSRSDCELACDARVMQGFSQAECEAYGLALLAIIRDNENKASLVDNTTAMTGSRRALFERIVLIGKRPRALAWVGLAVALAALAIGVVACSDGEARLGYAETLYGLRTQGALSEAHARRVVAALDFPSAFGAKRPNVSVSHGEYEYLRMTFNVDHCSLNDEDEAAVYKKAFAAFAIIDKLGMMSIELNDGERANEFQLSRSWADYLAGGPVSGHAESPEAFEALLGMEPYNPYNGAFIVSRTKDGSRAFRAYPMSEENNAVCAALLEQDRYDSGREKLPIIDITDSYADSDCIRLRKINVNQLEYYNEYYDDYFIYISDGTPYMQLGAYDLQNREVPPEQWRIALTAEEYNSIAALVDGEMLSGESAEATLAAWQTKQLTEYLAEFPEKLGYLDYQFDYTGDWDGDGRDDRACIASGADGGEALPNGQFVFVSFGNGDSIVLDALELEGMGEWGKCFRIEGADVTGDGVAEIMLFVSLGGNGGDGSFGLYPLRKTRSGYELMGEPYRGVDAALSWNDNLLKFIVGGREYAIADGAMVKECYSTLPWEEIDGQTYFNEHAADHGLCDMAVYRNGSSNRSVIETAQYVTGLSGVHADRMGYIVTSLIWNEGGELTSETLEFLLLPQ